MDNYFENMTFTLESNSFDLKKSLEFVECHFIGIDFSKYNLSHFKFLDCEFHECNLSNCSLKGASFKHSIFKKSKLMGLNWFEAASVSISTFSECILDYSIFHSMNLKGFTFTDCKMMEVEFSESELTKALINRCMLKGSTFNKANLQEADLRGSTEYYIDVRYTNVKKAKFSMPEALSLLSSLDIIVE